MSLEAVLLGSGGWIPTRERETCCALLRLGSQAVLLDAGTGISRLVEQPQMLEGVTRLDIVLTHFHLDHVVGLAYLPALDLPSPPLLHGPGQWLYRERTADILARMLGAPLFALGPNDLFAGVEEIPQAGLTVGDLAVSARVQARHNHPTLALRVEDHLTLCTDTAFDEGNIDFARGSTCLLHEAWFTEDAPRDQATHCSAAGAGRLARQAGVERLVLIHVRPGAHTRPLVAEARREFQAATAGEDLMSVLPARS